MMGQIHAMAAAIAAAFLIPPAVVVIEGALILCWAFAESILDVRELFAGGKVPLTKNASNWQLSLQGLPALVDKDVYKRQGWNYSTVNRINGAFQIKKTFNPNIWNIVSKSYLIARRRKICSIQ